MPGIIIGAGILGIIIAVMEGNARPLLRAFTSPFKLLWDSCFPRW